MAVAREQVDLGEALARARAELPDERDRGLVTGIVSGTLRFRAAIDYQLVRLLGRPLGKLDVEVLTSLRLACFQLIYLSRVPPAAVVTDAVSLVRRAGKSSAAGLTNAVLRRLSDQRHALPWPERPRTRLDDNARDPWLAYLSTVHSHPTWLVERWLDRYGLDDTETWLRFNNEAPTLTLATNLLRTTREALAVRLTADGVDTRPTAFASAGLKVVSGQPLTSSAFRQGDCVIQDEASQLIAEVVGVETGDCVLDLCAAPGGKTVRLAADVGATGHVVAADVRPRRVQLLTETLRRTGAADHRTWLLQVASAGPLPFSEAVFDRVLIDAPCSGLGTLRRNPDIRWRRCPADLAAFAAAQLDLLNRAAPVVQPEGWLVYSTCSSEPDENELVVEAFLRANPAFDLVPVHARPALSSALTSMATPNGCFRTFPFRDGLDAFFAAVLARTL